MKDDLISRQAAIDIVKFECGEWRGLAKTITDEFKHLPSAEPERKTVEQQPPYVAEIEEEYKKAVNAKWIRKPLAKALYEVWKKHDREDAERRTDD